MSAASLTRPGSKSATVSSSERMPRSARSRVSAATKVFVTLPMRKRSSTDASPLASSRTCSPSRNRTITPGTPLSTTAAAAASSDADESSERSATTATRAAAARPATQSRRTGSELRHGEGDGHVRGRLLRSRARSESTRRHRLVGCVGQRLRRAAALDDRGHPAERDVRRSGERLRARACVRDRGLRAPGGRARPGRRSRATARRPGSRPRRRPRRSRRPPCASSLIVAETEFVATNPCTSFFSL